jgi:hypothetical protein
VEPDPVWGNKELSLSKIRKFPTLAVTLLELNLVIRVGFRWKNPWHTLRGTEWSMGGSSESGKAEMMGIEQKERFTQ